MQLERIADLMREAAFEAGKATRPVVTRADVEAALEAQIRRIDRIPQLMHEMIDNGTVDIDTSGAVVGQINGLSVSQIGVLSFGRPARITARISLGKGDVVDIEREVDLGGPIHSKGVLILSNLIRARFGQDRPLCLHASLAFEQSYGGVDGDSASLAEACALLSAISGVPIKQQYAVTGSINQLGQVQAIGGVNEKVEGFFDVCVARGLSEGQGVLIPATNARNLVLAERVVDAVRDGRFAVIAVETLEEAVEALMGKTAGSPDPSGAYADGTVFAAVAAALERLDRQRKAAALPRDGEEV
jgi:predicted ATP-dependent protease